LALVLTNAGAVVKAFEGITNTPDSPPLELDSGPAANGIQNALPDAPEELELLVLLEE
jgi:hypothetical protein